ncbi:MAG: glycoside hydrolase family 127 protein [Chloroflexi bacterium]|nr:glycoside hydrolase family 127 protein [Chloroflexota bacterium]OJV89490.1 MAG: hypothetical protein BGO39_36600 [Chloroflexi bacterium 54-19]
MQSIKYQAFKPLEVQLTPGLFQQRYDLNRNYLVSLKNENLLQNFYLEAGRGEVKQIFNTLHGDSNDADGYHWGWESPTCQVRGHFLGHWLSAAARDYANTGNPVTRQKADWIINELEKCQADNGGDWVFSIPEKYLTWIAQGKHVWAPQYTLHKTLMGLFDAYKYTGNEQALAILKKAANWFHRWTDQFDREKMDDILDVETGGMLEVWADLYGETGEKIYLDLLDRYYRPRLFEKLLEGKDALTNMHANTTIPEAIGAARAYEVTGEEKWRKIAEAYWKCAVDDRGTYCTGGQTSGEIWTPPFEFAARRGDKNQEHCTVYNMMRLADFLFRWSGEVKYLDYIERNNFNGILAQQHPMTGMITYFLPLEAGARKRWGTPTHDFWCCHGSLVQAHTLHNAYIYYSNTKEVTVAQYIPSRLNSAIEGTPVKIEMDLEGAKSIQSAADNNSSLAGSRHRSTAWTVNLKVSDEKPVDFTLRLRLPWWMEGQPSLVINGETVDMKGEKPGFYAISRIWQNDTVTLELPKGLTASPIPDEPETVAFLDGPVVLAGLCDRETTLKGDKDHPERLFAPDNERQWAQWLSGYRTVGQPQAIRFKPLYEVVDELYTVYFPISG